MVRASLGALQQPREQVFWPTRLPRAASRRSSLRFCTASHSLGGMIRSSGASTVIHSSCGRDRMTRLPVYAPRVEPGRPRKQGGKSRAGNGVDKAAGNALGTIEKLGRLPEWCRWSNITKHVGGAEMGIRTPFGERFGLTYPNCARPDGVYLGWTSGGGCFECRRPGVGWGRVLRSQLAGGGTPCRS